MSFTPARLTTLLIAVLLASPQALADNAGPQLYGRINLSLEHLDYQGAAELVKGLDPADLAAAQKDHWELRSNSSNFGLKGGIGMEVSDLQLIYQLELGIDVDGKNNDVLSQRNSYIGFAHPNYGRIFAGKYDSPLKRAEGKVDQFGNIRGDMDALIGGQSRLNNLLQYSSPRIAEQLQLHAAAILGEGAREDNSDPDSAQIGNSWSAAMVYDIKHIYAALAYDHNLPARRSIDGIERGQSLRLVSKLSLANIEAGLLLQQNHDGEQHSRLRDDSLLVNGAWIIQRAKLKLQYGISKGRQSGERGQLYAAGIDYRLASKTFVYSYLSRQTLQQANIADRTIGIGLEHVF